jgi:GNAT superfamily N-acetyltransferase
MGSIALSVSQNAREYDAYWWWVVKDGFEVVGASLRTAPFGLQLGPMPVGAATLLAAAVTEVDDGFPWIIGPEAVVVSFLDAYRASQSSAPHREFTAGRTSLIYEVTDLVMPKASGTCRLATLDDFDLVNEWTTAFIEFLDEEPYVPTERDLDALRMRLTSESLRLWLDGNVPVSMAGHAPAVRTPSGTITRVGPVYTPVDHRGHGYGSAVTASLSEELLRGESRVILHADEANPTSNSIYQKIGYQLIDKTVQYDLVESIESTTDVGS